MIKTENEVNNGVMNKFFNENQANFRLFDLCIRFFKGFLDIILCLFDPVAQLVEQWPFKAKP